MNIFAYVAECVLLYILCIRKLIYGNYEYMVLNIYIYKIIDNNNVIIAYTLQ